VNATPNVDVCANCGAPLELDESGGCRWCHARIHTEQAVLFSLVPEDVDDCWSTPFLFLALSTLGPLLSKDPAVQQHMRREPGLLQQIRAMSTAVGAAGVRVRDAGLLRDDLDDRLAPYTPEEVWTFDLAFDVIAMLGALDGLSGRVKAKATSDLRQLGESTRRNGWDHAMKKATEGPAALSDLRARVPHRA
jgi:hypothetical protein